MTQCGEEGKDVRPYGPRGGMICFDCAQATPESRAETARNFSAQMEAAGPFVFFDADSELGPYPAEHHPIGRAIIAAIEAEE